MVVVGVSCSVFWQAYMHISATEMRKRSRSSRCFCILLLVSVVSMLVFKLSIFLSTFSHDLASSNVNLQQLPVTEPYIIGNFSYVSEIPFEDRSRNKQIMFMEGWSDDEWFYESDFGYLLENLSFDTCGYQCSTLKIGEGRLSEVDLVIFQPNSIRGKPPKKISRQIWVLLSFEDESAHNIPGWMKYNYDSMIDIFHIQSPSAATPLTFNKQVNAYHGTVPKIAIHQHFDAEAPLHLFQVVSTCKEYTGKHFREKLLPESPGYLLKTLDYSTELYHLQYCQGQPYKSVSAKPNRFVILDNSTCLTSVVGQLQAALYHFNNSIPVILQLPLNMKKHDIARFVPPNSFISGSDFSSFSDLLRYMKKVVKYPRLHSHYHKWRKDYVPHTKAGKWHLKNWTILYLDHAVFGSCSSEKS